MHGHLLTLILSMWMTCIDVFASFWFWLHFELDRQTRDQSSCVMCYLGLKIGGEELFIIFMEGREEGNLLRVNARCSFCLSTLIWQVYTVKYVNYDIFTWLTSYLTNKCKQRRLSYVYLNERFPDSASSCVTSCHDIFDLWKKLDDCNLQTLPRHETSV